MVLEVILAKCSVNDHTEHKARSLIHVVRIYLAQTQAFKNFGVIVDWLATYSLV